MTDPRPAPFSQPTLRAPWWCYVVIIAAAFVAYHNSFHGPFVFDDASSIITNPTIRNLWPLTGPLAPPRTNVTAQGRPILNLSLAINHALGGTKVETYHVANLLIHTLAGLTLFGIVRRVWPCRERVGSGASADPNPVTHLALVTAVLWTVHPLQTESVTYVIQRAESLVGLFYLLTIYGFVRAQVCHSSAGRPPQRKGWLTVSVIACLLGMATKEVMATAPLMVLFFDRTFFSGTFSEAWRRRRVYYLALGCTWFLLAWLVVQTGGNRGGSVGFGVGVGWWDYAFTQFKAMGRYVWLSVWPHPLVFEYGAFEIQSFSEIAFEVAMVLGLVAATIYGLRRRSPLGFLGAWFFGILAPTSLAPGTTQMIVEHRMYLPLAAVIVAMVAGLQAWLAPRRFSIAWFCGMMAIALTLLTIRRNADYRSDIALWTDTIAKRPQNPLAHFMLAGAHERAGNVAAALVEYERALDLKPDFSIGHENFGDLLLRQGRRVDAIAHFESALRLQPEYPDAHANLGNAYLAEGMMTEAVGHLEKAAQLTPDVAMIRYNFGNALAAAGLPGEAVSEYEAAIKLQSDLAEAHFNLANVLLELQRSAEAIAHYEAAVKARPDYAAAHYNLANALAASGRTPDAVGHYEAALRARPDYAEAHHNLGSALFELGRLPEAAQQYEETLQLRPDFPNARANLERVRARINSR